MKNYSLIGKRLPRIDSKDKVKRRALYTDDMPFPGMLCGMILCGAFPHANILAIDTSRAQKMPGVKAIITGEDTLKVNCGVVSQSGKYMDEFRLAVENVRFTAR